MTQLDRLEALAEKGNVRFHPNETREVLAALPDLIRVARAAKDFLDTDFDDRINAAERETVLRIALAPLYREVEG